MPEIIVPKKRVIPVNVQKATLNARSKVYKNASGYNKERGFQIEDGADPRKGITGSSMKTLLENAPKEFERVKEWRRTKKTLVATAAEQFLSRM